MDYEPVIGIEVHAKLKTNTKMFCDCLNDTDERHPNVNICPVCTGHPGVLPTINKKAVETVIKVGFALGGKTPEISKFDRKNYFYPDLPKGYQISQYDKPLISGGELRIKHGRLDIDKKVRITRIHLEEDAARMIHADAPEGGNKASLVDYNRAGGPLMELVTEPDIRSAQEARLFGEELRAVLRYLGASGADMEKGEMRIEANVSIRPKGSDKLSPGKVEIKNINSFRAVEAAVLYEIARQEKVVGSGKEVIQETRGWRDDRGITESQRTKEEAHDYRYFPEPDLPVIETAKLDLGRIRNEIPELPGQKLDRFEKEYGLDFDTAYLITRDRAMGEFFEETVSELRAAVDDAKIPGPAPEEALLRARQTFLNYFTNDLRGLLEESGEEFEHLKITPAHMADLITALERKEISSRIAKDLLREMFETGGDPHEIIKDKGMEQVSDSGEIERTVLGVLEKNAKAVEDYRGGKEAALQFLFGQSMRELKGKGNPEKIREILTKLLK